MNRKIVRATSAQLQDAAFLFDLYRQFGGHASDPERAVSFLEERLQLNDSTIFLAYLGSNVVGFMQLYPSFSSGRMRRIWILNDLYVEQSARSKGIATSLLEEAKRFALTTNAIRLELDVEISNLPAQSLYVKKGWKKDDDFFHFECEL